MERDLKRLEYDKILEHLASFCGSVLGRERALALRPYVDKERIVLAQAETTEARKLLRLEPSADLGGWSDIRLLVERSRHQAMLDARDLFTIGQTLTACRRIKKFFQDKKESYPQLAETGLSIGTFPDLEKKINSAILPGLEISDHASVALARIRRQIARKREQIKEKMQSIVRSPSYQKYLQESLVTVREGRYVIPVRQELRQHVPGIIHDQSASGATVFIEPMAVVGDNNELRRLEAAEKQEIIKILSELTSSVAACADELLSSVEALGRLDFIMAKARYSHFLDAGEPEIIPFPLIDIKKGRHPLLSGRVVPVDVYLGQDFNTLIITGPNTGGKTVALKTIGLLVLMAQSGLHIPADSSSRLGIFKQIFADIGDEQSIEQSLSTFSSHLTNIIRILESADQSSLVLLDELGAGTDPTEGAALAQAVLEKLHETGAKTVTATHYSELKNFASAREGMENACVEFDALTLKPTYRLLIGRPGHSNAFEIAARLGMDAGLVSRAKEFLSAEQVRVSELMNILERERQELEQELEQARYHKQEAQNTKERYQQMEQDLFNRRKEILARANEEARHIVKKIRQEAEEAIRELRARLASESAREREVAIQKTRQKLRSIQEVIEEKVAPPGRHLTDIPEKVAVGQEVYIPRYNQRAWVVSADEDGNVQVQVGVIRLTVPSEEVRVIEKEEPGGVHDGIKTLVFNKARNISSTLDLRGLRADEALREVEKYLDNAGLAGLSRAYLVHGKGKGILRDTIQQHLKGDRRVKSFRLGEQAEGGEGVTVVELAD